MSNLLIKNIESVLNDDRVSQLHLKNDVSILKQTITMIINNNKEKCLEAFVKYSLLFDDIDDADVLCGLTVMKFITDIDDIAVCVELQKL